ncbi:MAG: hypothetical protein KC503_38870 [Myxococcales bacterium]|nr:hypothetical protein [Myxococcales bacterium]
MTQALRYRFVLALVAGCAVVALDALPAAAAAADGDEVRTRLSLTPGRVDVAQLTIKGFTPNRTPGQPALPQRDVRVALHPRADLATLRLEISSGPVDSVGAGRSLAANPPFRFALRGRVIESWGSAATRVAGGRDVDAYGRAVWPARVLTRGRVSNRRGLRVLHLSYAPLRYRASTGELLLDRATTVTVRYRLRSGNKFAADPQLRPYFARLQNSAQAKVWYNAAYARDTAVKPGYAIVISDALAKDSKQLAPFIAQKQRLGYAVTVVSDKDRASVQLADPNAGDAVRLRTWLQNNYKPLNLRYVLIVGNPDPRRDGVPMLMTKSLINQAANYIPAPSDSFFADLTGDWDVDKDGNYAVYPNDGGNGGVDFAVEVYVGRIPIYDGDVKVLDSILAKTIAYIDEPGDRAWRKRVLQPAAMLFFDKQYGDPTKRMDGADVADPIYKQVIESHGLTQTTLYETQGLSISNYTPDIPLTRENLIAEWKKGYGLVTMVGHGSSSGIFRHIWLKDGNKDGIPDYQEVLDPPFFSYDDLIQLDDSRPSIVFHNSCSNGTPEDPTNLGAGLLRHGAVATVSSTREAYVVLDSSIFNLVRDTIGLMMQNKSLGEALFVAKEQLSDKAGAIAWFTRLETSLYGDPSISLVSCSANADCDDGKLCNGAEKCTQGQCVPGEAVACTSDDPCTESRCDESKGGKCVATARPDGEACDDQKFCTVGETCQAGACVGAPRCAAPGNPCVASACDEAKKTCDVTPTAENETCHAGTDREGVCNAGICEPSSSCAVGGAPADAPGTLAGWALLALLGLAFAATRRKLRGRR